MMTPSPLKTHPKRRMGRCCRSDFSYSLGSADLDYPMSPSLKIHRLAWRLVSLRRREGRTNVVRKRVAKKLKVIETTSQDVSSSSRVVEYLFLKHCMLIVELQEIPLSDPIDLGEEDDWDTVGGATERSRGPAPTVEEIVPESAQQATGAGEPPTSTKEGRPEPYATTAAVDPVVAHVKEDVPAEAGLVNIASILGAPTVIVV
jgi:hypothetical protein